MARKEKVERGDPEQHMTTHHEEISHWTLLSIISLNRETEVPTQTRLHANEDTR